MRQNFKRNKKRIEEAKKKRQEEKRDKRLGEKPSNISSEALPGSVSAPEL